MSEMIAVRVHRYGGPDELVVEETAVPEPSESEALIRVSAAGVGPWDALVRTGRSGLPQRLPLTPGSDIAGIVEKLGADGAETLLEPGDAVYGVTNPSFTGGYAQYAVAALGSIARKPSSISFAEAASAPVVAVTAWEMLFDHADLRAGQTVLVHGAAGNVGAYAVQLARWCGAHVVGVGSASDENYVRGIGAATFIDYATQRFEQAVHDVDVVIDTVGGESQERSFPIIRRGGILVSSVSLPSEEDARRFGVRTAYFIVTVTTERLNQIARLVDQGILKIDLGIVLRLADARKAHEMLAGKVAHPRGKIVFDITLTPDSP
jgi:NADPH:quinone reductase-like Zn-dependent oxidoreductase